MLPASTLGGYVGARTDESGNLTLHGLNFSVGGNFELYAYTEDLMPALSRSIAVIRPPAILPCPEETCQWASTASAGVGSRLPDVSDITLLASLTADGEVGMPDWPDSLNHVSIGQPHTAVGPADMEGCGLSNRGLVWEPYGGRDGRWLLLGFRTPVFATRVAVYESHAYGSVQQLLLLDEDNGYHAILDQEQGDRDLADCLRSLRLLSADAASDCRPLAARRRRRCRKHARLEVAVVTTPQPRISTRRDSRRSMQRSYSRLRLQRARAGRCCAPSSMLAGPRDSNAVPSASRVIALARAVG